MEEQMGFFHERVVKIANLINEHFHVGNIINVKHIRKASKPEIHPENRSEIIFIGRALEFLNHGTFLELIVNTSPKKYKIIDKMDIDVIKSMIVKHATSDIISKCCSPEPHRPIEEITRNVDEAFLLVANIIRRFPVNTTISTTNIVKRLLVPETASKHRISMFVSKVLDFLVQEGVIERRKSSKTRKFEIMCDFKADTLCKGIATKFPMIVQLKTVLKDATQLVS